MKIRRITLNNFGLFENIEISLSPTKNNSNNITVFVGNNGTGKTSILEALGTALSWFIARLRKERGSGNFIADDDILNTANGASIEIEVFDRLGALGDFSPNSNDQSFQWSLAKNRKGRKAQYDSHLNDCTRLANFYREALSHNHQISLPLIAFYPVERVVVDISLKLKNRHSFSQLDGYDTSLIKGVNFCRFFEWFREREDAENESGIPENILNQLKPILQNNQAAWRQLTELNASARDRQLTAVRTAIHHFMPHLDNLRVRRQPRLHMAIDKNGETLNVAQLSQGEKSLIALVGDIARRLAMLNPDRENPLAGDGIVLIDEIDLHLHPSWQRSLCDRLIQTFPNCQFVLTTHSPLVISDCKDILVYMLTDGQLQKLPSQYGQDVNTVLLDVMDTSIRDEKINVALNDLLDAIQDSKFTEAQQLLTQLTEELPINHLELVKAKLLLRKQELRHASH